MAGFVVFYDANVLYPNRLRDLLIRVAQTRMFQAKWSSDVLDEVFRNILLNRPDLDSSKLDRTRELMCAAVDDCLVTGYESLVSGLVLPDPGDRHVLAAAIKCGAQVIVTDNLRDFPASTLARHDIQAQSADDFLCDLIDLNGALVHQSVTLAASALRKPPHTVNDFLDGLGKCGALNAAALLRR